MFCLRCLKEERNNCTMNDNFWPIKTQCNCHPGSLQELCMYFNRWNIHTSKNMWFRVSYMSQFAFHIVIIQWIQWLIYFRVLAAKRLALQLSYEGIRVQDSVFITWGRYNLVDSVILWKCITVRYVTYNAAVGYRRVASWRYPWQCNVSWCKTFQLLRPWKQFIS